MVLKSAQDYWSPSEARLRESLAACLAKQVLWVVVPRGRSLGATEAPEDAFEQGPRGPSGASGPRALLRRRT